jgi:glycosyltransferase involved in cell wall biosynthesis/ubiquinone/menaquinone biosynthesis C-methylase UbiE
LRLLSVLIPVYNEEETVGVLIDRVIAAPLPEGIRIEIVAVDDASTDDSVSVVKDKSAQYPDTIRLIRQDRNRGKGAAVRTAIAHANGEFAIIQDADLEYDPNDYARLLQPLVDGKADAVYGSRFLVAGERRVLYYWHAIANHALTTLCNMVADINLTDMETCYKAFRLSLVKSIPLRSSRFGIEPEITIKLAQRRACIYEMPISYHGRTYAEGKKIGLSDAVQAFFIILRYGFGRDAYLDSGAKILDALAHTPRFNEWMASRVRPYLGPTVLELGAGIGNLTLRLARGRKRYVATDVDPEHIGRLHTRFGARPNIAVRRCDLESSDDFAPLAESVSTVICLNVLEHVADDMMGLRNIHSALEPGGRAIVLVPNDPKLYGTLDRVLEHHRRYTLQELTTKLHDTGFTVEQIFSFNRVTRPGWILNGRILRRSSFGRIQLAIFDSLVSIWRRIDDLLPWGPVSLIAVAKKPEH